MGRKKKVLVQLSQEPRIGAAQLMLLGDKPEKGEDDTRERVTFTLGSSGYMEGQVSEEAAAWCADEKRGGGFIVGDAALARFNGNIFHLPEKEVRTRFALLIDTSPERAIQIVDSALERGVVPSIAMGVVGSIREQAETTKLIRQKEARTKSKAARAAGNAFAAAAATATQAQTQAEGGNAPADASGADGENAGEAADLSQTVADVAASAQTANGGDGADAQAAPEDDGNDGNNDGEQQQDEEPESEGGDGDGEQQQGEEPESEGGKDA